MSFNPRTLHGRVVVCGDWLPGVGVATWGAYKCPPGQKLFQRPRLHPHPIIELIIYI